MAELDNCRVQLAAGIWKLYFVAGM